MTQKNKYQTGNIVKFNIVLGGRASAIVFPSYNYNKRQNTWNDWDILPNHSGIILELQAIENTIKSELQKYYQGKDFIPYLWYCFKTAKTYLVFQCEMH